MRVVASAADVTHPDDVQRVIDETIKQLGRIDVLVNNAGDGWISSNLNGHDNVWRNCMEVNLYSAVRFTPRRRAPYAAARRWRYHGRPP